MIRPELRDLLFEQRRWRNGPLDMALTPKGLLLPGDHALYKFFEDFDGARGSLLSAAGVTGWHEDADGTPTSLALIADGIGGTAFMQPGGTATNNVHYHWGLNTTVHEPFTMSLTKRLWLAARFKIEDADQNLLIFGLHEAQDDPWATEPNDQFLFRTVSGTPATLRFAGGTANNAEQTFTFNNEAGTAQQLSDDTWYTALAFYDGGDPNNAGANGSVTGWLFDDNGAVLGSGRCNFDSTILPTTPMSVAFGVEALDTGTDAFTLDYIAAYMER